MFDSPVASKSFFNVSILGHAGLLLEEVGLGTAIFLRFGGPIGSKLPVGEIENGLNK
jgi:hypothetical protein